MNETEVIMKSKITFPCLDSNRLRLAILQKWTNLMKSKTTFHWLDSNRNRLAICRKWSNSKFSWNQKPHFTGSIPIELDYHFAKNEQTRSYHEIKTTFHWLDSNQIRLAIYREQSNPKLSWNRTPFHWLDFNRIGLDKPEVLE
jgi:hypothetical protein